jgi:uncharacterized hydrophobic protein (TIGR00271 family)
MEKFSGTVSSRRVLVELRSFLRDRFNLHEDGAGEQETIEEIKRGVAFRGANLWILMFAILICSIGLNVNSTAVVIGAMLISPLMGPIMGVGMGVGINDIELIVKSMKNLAIAVAISVLTSTLYFLITPLTEAQSELLARTTPTLWDVLIALFGGLAGIVAGSRREKSNAIPGVAIATALMPPLCTSGYGLATGQWHYFVGAFYLFFINSVFISLATVVIVRALGYSKKEFLNPKRELQVRRLITIFVVITIIPSIYTAVLVVQRSVFEQRAREFVAQELHLPNVQVINRKVTYENRKKRIEVITIGDPIDPETEAIIQSKLSMPKYKLRGTELVINQGFKPDEALTQSTLAEINARLRTGIIEDLYKKNEEIIQNKDKRIALLESEILRLQARDLPVGDIAGEVKALNNKILEFSISSSILTGLDSLKQDTVYIAYARFRQRPSRQEVRQLEEWLKARAKTKSLRLVTE